MAVLASACIMLFVSFQLGFFLLIFAAMGWWAWENPESGFLFLLIAFPLLPLFKVTQTIGSFTLVKDIIILVLFFKLFLLPLLGKRLPYRRSILFGPVMALLAWTALETLRADSLTLGILRARDVILYLLLYFVVLYLPADERIWKRRLGWFVISFLVAALHAGYQWFFASDSAVLRFDPGRQIWIPRISSTFGHPSVYGEYLIAAATLFISCTLFLKRKWIFTLLTAISLPLIFLTYSRAVWIGFAAAVGVMGTVFAWRRFTSPALPQGGLSFVRRSTSPLEGEVGLQRPDEVSKKRWLFVGIALLAIIILFVFVLRFTPAGPLLRSAFDPTYKSNEERLEFAARLVAPMSNFDAIFGRGLGDVVQQKLLKTDVGAEEIAFGESREVQLAKDATLVDNQYLKTFVEMGLAGLMIYFWLFWSFVRGCWEAFHPSAHLRSVQRVIGMWGLAFLATFAVQALFIDIWDIFPTNAMFWMVGGLVSAALTPYTKTT